MPIADRRQFLKTAGLATGAMASGLLLGDCASSRPRSRGRTSSPEPLLDRPASSSPIDHVVIVMQENRSFDHWLGWLAADHDYVDGGRRRYGGGFAIDGRQHQRFRGPHGPVATDHLPTMAGEANPWRGCGHPDPGHSWDEGRAERDHGFLSRGSGNDDFALGYYRGDDLPFTCQLAKRFMVCDRSFASVLGSTFPNREYLHSAQSGGLKDNTLPPATGFGWETIWDRLRKAGVSAGYYSTDLPVTFLWGPRLAPISHKVDEYFERAKAGTLPQVSMVDPGFLSGSRTDNHPFGDIRAGERFARDVFAAFAASPHWRHGAFFLTYDEWGGFFEHVKPPTFADDRASAVDAENFGQAGFRVPTIVASPYAPRGSVDHRRYDHTSILRFLEWRFLGAPAEGPGGRQRWWLTTRDRHAANLGRALVTVADRDLGFDTNVQIGSPSAACPGEAGGLGAAYHPDPRGPFDDALDRGTVEAAGADPTPSAMAGRWVTA